jgi:hypothetical protein
VPNFARSDLMRKTLLTQVPFAAAIANSKHQLEIGEFQPSKNYFAP